MEKQTEINRQLVSTPKPGSENIQAKVGKLTTDGAIALEPAGRLDDYIGG